MQVYKHVVQYYETDKMGIVHHSNYIRWMEEARVDFLAQIGWDYAKLEEYGVVSPVIAIECRYKSSAKFADEVFINVRVEEFKGVRLKLCYEMNNAEGTLLCEGRSEHCFLDEAGNPMMIKREYPAFYKALIDLVGVN